MGDRAPALRSSMERAAMTRRLLLRVVAHTALRDETFVQIMKQLSDNPRRASCIRGWTLLDVCLKSFPPSDILENFLEGFVRTRTPGMGEMSARLSLLYQTALDGAKPVPSMEQLCEWIV